MQNREKSVKKGSEKLASTDKIEGFNNKIKVAKRAGYGHRDKNTSLP